MTSSQALNFIYFSNIGSWHLAQYISYIATYGACGDATKKNSGICGVGEMWGFYVGGLLATEHYGGDQHQERSWFWPGILRRLVDVNELTHKQVYECLTSDVRSHELLKNKLISRYGKETQIKATFKAFGF